MSEIDSIQPTGQNPKIPYEDVNTKNKPSRAEEQAFRHAYSSDPSQVWAKFLSCGGIHDVTEQDVKMFIQGLEKMLQITVQQNARAAKRGLDKMKDAQEGR